MIKDSKKIYICGSSMTGKAQMMQLIDGNKDIFTIPYHNFGISFLSGKFEKFIINNSKTFFHSKYFNKKDYIKIDINNNYYDLPIVSLIKFIINNNSCIDFILESHYSHKCYSFISDTELKEHEFKVNINDYINNIYKNFKTFRNNTFNIEIIENIIFHSFVNSVDGFKDYKNYLLCGNNSINQVYNLINFFKNYKLIIINRRTFDKVFSISLRNFYNQYNNKINIFDKKLFFILLLITNSSKIINKTSKYNKQTSNLNHKNILHVDFDEMFKNRESLLNKIYQFLEIKRLENKNFQSFLSEKISNYNPNVEDQYIDDPKNYLSNFEINIINFIILNKPLRIIFSNISRLIIKIFYKIEGR